jgi:hypothetical protein
MNRVDVAAAPPETAKEKPATRSERRTDPRIRLYLPVRIRPEDFRLPEEVRPAQNSSDNGLYFTTWRDTYYPGMHLRLVYPYLSTSAENQRELKAEVVRVETLPNLQIGVAVRFRKR